MKDVNREGGMKQKKKNRERKHGTIREGKRVRGWGEIDRKDNNKEG